MADHKVVFLTERSPRHQEDALNAAPAGLRVTMLRQPTEKVLLREVADANFLISERAGEVDGALLACAKLCDGGGAYGNADVGTGKTFAGG